jgi:hypothetical protein
LSSIQRVIRFQEWLTGGGGGRPSLKFCICISATGVLSNEAPRSRSVLEPLRWADLIPGEYGDDGDMARPFMDGAFEGILVGGIGSGVVLRSRRESMAVVATEVSGACLD